VNALRKAVEAMKIQSALSHLKEGFHHCMQSMKQDAANVAAISTELHSANEHMRNIGRTLTGKQRKALAPLNQDKGVLFKIQKIFLSCSNVFANMEQLSDNAMKRVEQFGSRDTGKPSVKAELKRMKSRGAKKQPIQSIAKEKSHKKGNVHEKI
jgi:hypothetical protein